MDSMQAIEITKPGGPDVLSFGEIPLPTATGQQIRVEVRATALNRADVLQREGHYPAPEGVPAQVPGLEYAGVVESVAPHAQRWKIGDRVMGLVGGGAFADFVVVHEDEALPIPQDFSFEKAAAIPEVFITAYDALFRQAHLQKEETVLIHAVASGVGTAAVQLARAFGCTSVGTSRSKEKLDKVQELGLDLPIHVTEGRFAKACKEFRPEGIPVILDMIGADYLEENLKVLATRGRLVIIGLLGGAQATLSLGRLLGKRQSILGTVLRSRPVKEKIEVTRDFAQNVLPLLEAETLLPVIDEVIPAQQVVAGFQRMEANQTTGKIVMTWPN